MHLQGFDLLISEQLKNSENQRWLKAAIFFGPRMGTKIKKAKLDRRWPYLLSSLNQNRMRVIGQLRFEKKPYWTTDQKQSNTCTIRPLSKVGLKKNPKFRETE